MLVAPEAKSSRVDEFGIGSGDHVVIRTEVLDPVRRQARGDKNVAWSKVVYLNHGLVDRPRDKLRVAATELVVRIGG